MTCKRRVCFRTSPMPEPKAVPSLRNWNERYSHLLLWSWPAGQLWKPLPHRNTLLQLFQPVLNHDDLRGSGLCWGGGPKHDEPLAVGRDVVVSAQAVALVVHLVASREEQLGPA